jgi:predicted DNA-binding WGR domain protein
MRNKANEMSEREFQLSEGTSHKFWSIRLDGKTHTVRFGRIGTTGQTQTKEYASEDDARRAYEKLIQEKVRKGYVEQSAVGSRQSAEGSRQEAGGRRQEAEGVQAFRRSGVQGEVPAPEPSARTPSGYPAPEPNTSTPSSAERRIELPAWDWLWATWRPHTPLPRPEPQPFDVQDCLARLRRVTVGRYSWHWDWSKLALDPSMSREEAHFWLAALMAVSYGADEKQLPKKLNSMTFTGDLDLQAVTKMRGDRTQWILTRGLGALARLLSPAEVLGLVLECHEDHKKDPKQNSWSGATTAMLMDGLRRHVLVYLSEAEWEDLRGRVRPEFDVSLWPQKKPFPDHYVSPLFGVAACLGMHEDVRALVESWADDQFSEYAPEYSDFGQEEILFGLGDPQLVAAHMRRLKARVRTPRQIRAWIAHMEYSGLERVRDAILEAHGKEDAQAMLEGLSAVKAPEAAPFMLELSVTSRAPWLARDWLDANAAHTVAGIVPLAASSRSRLQDAATDFLRVLKRRGHEPLIREALARQSAELAARVRAAVLEDPAGAALPLDQESTPGWLREALEGVSAERIPWINVADLPPVLVGERRLSDAQVGQFLAALRKSSLEKPHPLIGALKAHADRPALGDLAWAVFLSWLREGAPSKEKWALEAVGLLGDDRTALRLAPLVRIWPGENQHPRAVLGLECLRAIGTDTALMQINGIAQKLPFKALKAKAAECMEAIARERGFTRAELEDRIVPDCDLDPQGSRTFDFGPRQFRFVLGPALKPMVREDGGKAKPDLPKPTGKDDAALAAQALAEWKLLKKQVAEAIKVQSVRLEQAMVTGRRWSVPEFEMLLARHPLMINLVRLLVWSAQDAGGRPAGTFRVTEDGTYADARDESFVPDGAGSVGIAHPLHLPEEERAAWGEVFSDYELAPPFPQLGRAVYGLEAGEAAAKEITRFRDIAIPPAALVFTLEKQGWNRGVPEDAGVFSEHSKPFYGTNVTAVAQYDGVPVGYYEGWDDQKIERCFFVPGIYTPEMYPDHVEAVPLGEVDPVAISEVLNDLYLVSSKVA